MTCYLQTRDKDPDATLDFGFNYGLDPDRPQNGSWLDLDGGETIVASEWTVPSGLDSSSPATDGTKTVIWISGGTAGNSYTISNKITTSAGRIDERSQLIIVRER